MAEACALLQDCPDPGIARQLLTAAQGHLPNGTASDTNSHAPTPPLVEQLSSKELELLRLLPAPLSRREIGARLFVSLNTVKTDQRGLYRKLQVTSRAKAVERAKNLGLL